MPNSAKNTVGRQVDQLVAELDIEDATDEAVSHLAVQICDLGRDAVARLARSILLPGPERREKVAALLGCLEGESAAWALEELHAVLASRPLSPMERVWLLTTARSLEDAAAAGGASAASPLDGQDEPLPPDESELLYWRDELASLRPNDQEAALAPVLQSGDPGLLPLLEMAMSLSQPRLDAVIAGGLSRFATEAALPLLRDLLRRADPTVRQRARTSLLALERQGVDVRRVFVAASASEEPIAMSLATPLDNAGQMAVLLARRRGPTVVSYTIVILDTLEMGILRAWGETGLGEADVLERVHQYSEQSSLQFDRIDPSVAQGLVAAGEDFARQQARELSADYLAWRRLIGEPSAPVRLPVVFGPACGECASRVRRTDVEHGGIVAGDVALCARCAQKPRTCVSCGRAIHQVFDEFYVRRGREAGQVEFLCLKCARPPRSSPT